MPDEDGVFSMKYTQNHGMKKVIEGAKGAIRNTESRRPLICSSHSVPNSIPAIRNTWACVKYIHTSITDAAIPGFSAFLTSSVARKRLYAPRPAKSIGIPSANDMKPR